MRPSSLFIDNRVPTSSSDDQTSADVQGEQYYVDTEKKGGLYGDLATGADTDTATYDIENAAGLKGISGGSGGEETVLEGDTLDLDGKVKDIRLKKELKARHISMIAIGGSLGTGLLIGTGTALRTAGPGAVLITYSFVAILVFFVMSCLGEMATYIPLDGFTSYATRYCDPALGFAVGYAYLFKYLILPPNQLTAAALVIQYWVDRDTVNPGVWITIFLVAIVFINTFGVKYFGEFEFWLSSIKVLVMLGLIVFLIVATLGGCPNHDRIGFRYWSDPGAFKEYSSTINGDTGRFVSFVSAFVYAVFCYLGIELTGVVAAEAKNPRHSIPRAVKLTLYRIVVFYIATIFLLGMCVPSNDPQLASSKSGTSSASPFLIAIVNSGTAVLPDIFNVCILVFVFSACNSDLYVASRSLYGLAIDGKAPRFLAKTNRWGIPYYSLGVSVMFCFLAYMSVSSASSKVFNYLVNVVSIFGLLSWISILITYIYFDRAVRAQGIDKSTFAYYAPWQPYGAYITLFFCVLLALVKNFTVFLGGTFDYKTFITGYIGLPIFVLCYFGYKLVYKTKIHKPEEVDLYTYKDLVDQEEEDFKYEEMKLRESMRDGPKNMSWFYDKFLGKIF